MCLSEFWFSPVIHAWVGWWDHVPALFLGFWRNSILFSRVPVTNLHSTQQHRRVSVSHAISTFIVSRHVAHGHSDWCEVISPCSSHLHFSNNSLVEHLSTVGFFFFFIFSNRLNESYLLKLAFWKLALFWFFLPYPRAFLEDKCHFQPHRVSE